MQSCGIWYGYKLQVTYGYRYVDRYVLLQAREEAAVGATAGLEEGVLRCRRQLHVISAGVKFKKGGIGKSFLELGAIPPQVY